MKIYFSKKPFFQNKAIDLVDWKKVLKIFEEQASKIYFSKKPFFLVEYSTFRRRLINQCDACSSLQIACCGTKYRKNPILRDLIFSALWGISTSNFPMNSKAISKRICLSKIPKSSLKKIFAAFFSPLSPSLFHRPRSSWQNLKSLKTLKNPLFYRKLASLNFFSSKYSRTIYTLW